MASRRRAAVSWAAALLLAGFAHGYLTRATRLFPDGYLRPLLSGEPAEKQAGRAAGASRKARRTSPAPPPGATPKPAARSEDEQAQVDALMSLGYAAGYEPAREAKGVVGYDRASTQGGYNLLLSGHAPSAFLLDMDGAALHTWSAPFAQVWPEVRLDRAHAPYTTYWKRAYLYPNGDMIAMFERYGLVKLDRSSKVLWSFRGPVHHDLDVAEDGRIFALLHRAHRVPRLDADAPTLEDFLVVLDPGGRQVEEISILEAIERSRYANLLRVRSAAGGILHVKGDVLHTNTLALLDGRLQPRHPAFKKGNVLLAVRSLDLVAVLDPAKREIVWGLTGMWVRPHEPVLLADGGLLIFDNEGAPHDGAKGSRALEIDPLSQEVRWSYTGPPAFHSSICGQVQRLANGNTMITVATEGRVIEVTPAGRVVWEFLNPYSAVLDGEERVATIFEMIRLPRTRVASLLPKPD